MKRKLITVLLALCLLASLLAGCINISLPSVNPTKTAATEAAPETAAPTETAPEATAVPTEAPSATAFVRVADTSCDRFSNQIVEVLFRQNGNVVLRDFSSGQERTLFTLPPDENITISLIGVTDQRLYFGWNEVEDWWGVDVYSVDYTGGDRQELGSSWDPTFDNGWLLLLGFRSDVSATELLLIDRSDRIVAEEQNGAVWDAKAVGGSVYYLFVEDMPTEWPYDAPEGGCKYDLIRVDPSGEKTVLKVFAGIPNYYSPAFINEGVICLYDTNEFYDLLTLEPTKNPYS